MAFLMPKFLFPENLLETSPCSILREETGNPPGFYPQRERLETNSDSVLRENSGY